MFPDATLLSTVQDVRESIPSPFPRLGQITRWLFGIPSWIQIVGAIAALALLVWGGLVVWRRRTTIGTWLRTRSRSLQIATLASIAFAALLASVIGASGYNYTQHSNEFCTSCHVMDDAFTRFTDSEHSQLECHDCHRQPVTASLRQVYLWVTERPEDIGAHAPVPNQICAECHITADPDNTWQRISATAGHRVHLESDSTVLADVQCVTCHGVEIHRFVPVTETCAQSACHTEEKAEILLGGMANDTTGLHCVVCHEFIAPLPEDQPRSEAFAGLVPDFGRCVDCHEMQPLMADFDIESDPHDGVCGDCHMPHEQREPVEAQENCTTAGCHADPESLTPFHRDQHADVEGCISCHDAHTWAASTECTDCHEDGLPRVRPPRIP
jgi:hypothetical protein